MFLRQLVLLLLGWMSGVAVSAGTFAFLLVIGVVPRMLRTTNLMQKVLTVEMVIVAAVTLGNIVSLWDEPGYSAIYEWGGTIGEGIGHALLGLYGVSAGIFVGCISVALAEILHIFPILFRRLKMSSGLSALMFSMAFGKCAGALFSFLGGYHF